MLPAVTIDASRQMENPSAIRQSRNWICIFGLAFADLISFGLAEQLFRIGRNVPKIMILGGGGTPAMGHAVDIFLFLSVLFISIRYLAGDYSRRQLFWDAARLTTSSLLVAAIPDGLLFIVGDGQYSAFAFLETWLFLLFAIPLLRQFARMIMARAGIWNIPTALIGSGPRADAVNYALKNSLSLGYQVHWLVLNDEQNKISQDLKSLKTIFSFDPDEIASRLSSYGCSQAVVAMHEAQSPNFSSIIQRLMEQNISVSFVPSLNRLPVAGVNTSYFFGRDIMLFQVRNNLRRYPHRFVKRAFDLIGAIFFLLLFVPLFAFSAFAIKSYDGGPIVYSQIRSGRRGKRFKCLKFRTMAVDADEHLLRWQNESPELYEDFLKTYKLRDDPRITKPGRWLRRTSLDELPQLFNVLIGDMSLVGPRPVLERELRDYYGPAALLYSRVRPGLTGLWQVSGRSNTSYEQRVIYDEWYILNWSFWYDIVILLQTAWYVLLGKGAF